MIVRFADVHVTMCVRSAGVRHGKDLDHIDMRHSKIAAYSAYANRAYPKQKTSRKDRQAADPYRSAPVNSKL